MLPSLALYLIRLVWSLIVHMFTCFSQTYHTVACYVHHVSHLFLAESCVSFLLNHNISIHTLLTFHIVFQLFFCHIHYLLTYFNFSNHLLSCLKKMQQDLKYSSKLKNIHLQTSAETRMGF